MFFLHRLLIISLLLTVPSTLYLYFYPVFHGCSFPLQDASLDFPQGIVTSSIFNRYFRTKSSAVHPIAPFRFLTLGDPQLEGDSSLHNSGDDYLPTLKTLWTDIHSARSLQECLGLLGNASKQVLVRDVPAQLHTWRKQLDLIGNDYYLAHIYRTLHRHTKPTHVTVLGDLLGSQWIDDAEFERRGARFWQRVFRHGKKVEEKIMAEATTEILGEDPSWETRIMNLVGNHDVGYAGEMSVERVKRFERVFGRVNWEIKFQLPHLETTENTTAEESDAPELRIIILNSLNLDTPAKDPELQSQTYIYVNQVIVNSKPVEDRSVGTIFLTHLPLHKEAGVCVDGPFFDFHSDGSGVKEQNHISYNAGLGVLEGIFGMSGDVDGPGGGMGRKGVIMTGHDHEGCDVYHHLPANESADARRWNVTRWQESATLVNDSIPGVREITVRSMMGDYGGNAGLLSAWFDYDGGEWRFAYSTCSVGVQHIWWTVHVLLAITGGLLLLVCSKMGLDSAFGRQKMDGVIQLENHKVVRGDMNDQGLKESRRNGSARGKVRKRQR